MQKILHLSDLHIGFGPMQARFEYVVEQLVGRLQPAAEHVIVITGDLVEKAGGRHPYREARDAIARLEQAGFATLVAPGNHDYTAGSVLSKRLVAPFKETFFGDAHIQYPKVDLIGDVAFIGLDSMAEELHWYDAMFADGELGDAQLARLDALLGDSTIQACRHRVVYLHHHPFTIIPLSLLKDAHKLKAILTKHGNIDALLFGHHHMGKERHGTWGIQRCYDGGTATGKTPGVTHQRLIHLDKEPAADSEIDLALPD